MRRAHASRAGTDRARALADHDGATTDLRSAAAGRSRLDPYSTAIHFRGWKEEPSMTVNDDYVPLPSAEPSTWLLRVGWQRAGRISAFEVPGGI